jgi:hypothetical protein
VRECTNKLNIMLKMGSNLTSVFFPTLESHRFSLPPFSDLLLLSTVQVPSLLSWLLALLVLDLDSHLNAVA